MARIARIALGTVSAAAIAMVAAPAHADSAGPASAGAAPAECAGALERSNGGITLPANAPALLLRESSSGSAAPFAADLSTGESRTPLGAPRKDAHGLDVLLLPAELFAGTYKLLVSGNCYGPPDRPEEVPLTLTEAVPLPTAIGKLVHRPKNPPTGIDEVVVEPSPGLRAFLPAARISMSLNGAPARGAVPSPSSLSFNAPTGSVCVEDGALHREKRTVKITVDAAIAGVADTLPSETLEISVDCGAIKWTSDNDFRQTPASSASQQPGTSSTNADAGSCAAARPGAMGSPATLGVVGIALSALAVFRRRRRA